MASTTINSLPTEVLSMIVGYLNWQSLKNASRASRNLRHACLPTVFCSVAITPSKPSLRSFEAFTTSPAARHVKTVRCKVAPCIKQLAIIRRADFKRIYSSQRYVTDQELGLWKVLPHKERSLTYYGIHTELEKLYNGQQTFFSSFGALSLSLCFGNLVNMSKVVLEYSDRNILPVNRNPLLCHPHGKHDKLLDEKPSLGRNLEAFFNSLKLPWLLRQIKALHIAIPVGTEYEIGSVGPSMELCNTVFQDIEELHLEKTPLFLKFLGNKKDLHLPALKMLKLISCQNVNVQHLGTVCKKAKRTLQILELDHCDFTDKVNLGYWVPASDYRNYTLAFYQSLHGIGNSCSLKHVVVEVANTRLPSMEALLRGEIALDRIRATFMVN